jgi:predicted transcriptional regulator
MSLTPKQAAVLQFVHEHGQITKDQAMRIINTHYSNGAKHVGDCIGRMVKAGLLIRVKRGVFVRGTGKKNKPSTIDAGQIKMEL